MSDCDIKDGFLLILILLLLTLGIINSTQIGKSNERIKALEQKIEMEKIK